MVRVAPDIDEATGLHQAGALDAAAAIYRRILAADPDHHESLHLLGLVAYQQGDAAAAIAAIRRAVALHPAGAAYHSNLANVLRACQRPADACAALLTARSLRPGSAEIASNLGAVLTELGRWPEALSALRAAVELDPQLADAHYNLANALSRSGDLVAAVSAYRECLRLRPDFADAHFNLGHALAALGQPDRATDSYRQALARDPANGDAHNNLGALLQEADRLEAAEAHFAEAVRLNPTDPGTGCNLAACLLAQGRTDEAGACFTTLLGIAPEHGAARLGRLMSHLPVVASDEAEVARARINYAAELAQLGREAVDPAVASSLAMAIGTSQPFFLAYQGRDDLALQRRYGGLMNQLAGLGAAPAATRRGGKLRVAIVSGFFREHTIWTLFLQGWLERLDRSRFQLFGFHTGTRCDSFTETAARLCDGFVTGPRPPDAWRAAVLAKAPDIVLYPEIGMDPVASRLAAQRLAPVQCVAWGHPVTSGLPSMDYFLSSERMEPAAADAHYTERLVRLPNLGVWCAPPAPAADPPLDRITFGLRSDAVVYWSGQNLPKYHPQDDEVFPRIALAVPECQFVFIAFGRGREMTRRFAARLDRAFDRFGLDAAAHCVILPQLSQARFLAAAALADVVLDTIGWSGGKSTLDLLATDPVIVTLPGAFLRGRHTAAILRMMEAPETIADTTDDYVALAVRLGRDCAFRAAVRANIARRKHRVFADPTPILALEGFLEDAVRAA